MNRGLWNLSFFLTAVGLICLAAGAMISEYRKRKEDLKGHTTAQVVDMRIQELPGEDTSQFRHRYYPVIQFYAGGRLYKENYPYGAYPAAFQVGEELQIDYDPEDPHEYEIHKPGARQAVPRVVSACGILMTLTGAVLFIVFAARG